ncbi:hypothetical protein [Desmospora profundinema]|uniref:Myb-like domain-containing protein n=1 Tax=Desmospora profundinema TaxID=1571184 RepID=A0ABU1IKE2_9BACL|nr:hypothetical protein [Desmospora profundinema]MDR6225260.1 hypothetical protein [Desmospora profundinema]
MFDTKKGKYSFEENERIIEKMNEGVQEGIRERDILKELATELNRGFAGIMSHVRKLRTEYPERFLSKGNSGNGQDKRLNSWTEEEENQVIDRVNSFLEQGKSLSSAIAHLEKELKRTQGAIYQRIYTLRRKYPDRFSRAPESRPRRRRQLEEWQLQRPVIRNLNGHSISVEAEPKWTESHPETAATLESATIPSQHETSELELVIKAFENRYGKPSASTRKQLIRLMREYGHTRVSIALFTLQDDREFPAMIARFLESHLDKRSRSVK